MKKSVNNVNFDDYEPVVTILGNDDATPVRSLSERIKDVAETPVGGGLLLTQIKKNKKSKREKSKTDKGSKKKSKAKSIADEAEIYTSEGFITQSEFKKKLEGEDEFDKLVDIYFSDGEIADGDIDGEEIVRGQKNAYDKRKNDKNEYKAEFNDELTLLYESLQVATGMTNNVESQYNALSTSKTRGITKYSNDLLNNYNSLSSTRLNIIKSIVDIKKAAIDLKIKQEKNNKDDGSALSVNQTAASYLNKFFGDRNNYLSAVSTPSGEVVNTGMVKSDHFDDVVNEMLSENNDTVNTGMITAKEPDLDVFDELLKSRLEDEGNELRRETGTKNIEAENLNVRVVVYMDEDDNSNWEFVAIDGEGTEVPGYELPDVMHIGKMTFREKYASDERGRSYEIIKYRQ